METQQPYQIRYLQLIIYSILILLSVFFMPIVNASEKNSSCQTATIKSAFQHYVLTIDQLQVSNIQNQLNTSGYGPVTDDGILGIDTRAALKRLCQDFEVSSSKNLASKLIELLEMSATVSGKHPGWRKLIKSVNYNNWFNKKDNSSQENIKKTLQSGPAKKIITILDMFQLSQKFNKDKSDKNKINNTKKQPPTSQNKDDDPNIFYRWPPTETNKTDKTQAANSKISANITLPPEIIAKLSKIKGKTYANKFLYSMALKRLFEVSDINYIKDQKQIFQQSRQTPPKKTNEIKLSGDGCGCSRSFTNLVYGFYPYWLAEDKVQKVDFDLYSRINFYALSLNEKGVIANNLQWKKGFNTAKFINMAHKHRVKVDVTIQTSSWQLWTEDDIDTAASNVMKVVEEKFHSDNINILRTYIPLLEDTTEVTADGITLYFENYRASSSNDNIISLISKVAEKLKKLGFKGNLNVMFDLDLSNMDKNKFLDLINNILPTNEVIKDKDKVDHVFTFLQEPTSQSKKNLRQIIEDSFDGHERRKILRKIVPILTPPNKEDENKQFKKDLIYLQDNFSGVALWPLPLKSDAQSTEVKDMIINVYTPENSESELKDMLDNYAPWLCEYVCPNREWFRAGFDVLVGLLVLYGLLSIWFYELRSLYIRYKIVFLIAAVSAVLIFLVSLKCDPFWSQRSDLVVFLVFLAAVATMVIRYIRMANRPPLP